LNFRIGINRSGQAGDRSFEQTSSSGLMSNIAVETMLLNGGFRGVAVETRLMRYGCWGKAFKAKWSE
jgi:hypothetical protein